ncbi:MAG: hypothetical protein JRI94_04325 [Deltaproteobacteria bacterium]|nr:hypothetical protein [Deltaproteobacteria bacterium]
MKDIEKLDSDEVENNLAFIKGVLQLVYDTELLRSDDVRMVVSEAETRVDKLKSMLFGDKG